MARHRTRKRSTGTPAWPALALALTIASTALAAPAQAAAAPPCFGEGEAAIAVGLADPRSLHLSDGRIVRLAGIESFALLAADGDAAETALKQGLSRLIDDAPLIVHPVSDKPDRYGRIPALVAADATLLQERLTERGVAIAYPGSTTLPCFDRILAGEDRARRDRLGGWQTIQLPPAVPDALADRIGRFAIFQGEVLSVGNRRARTYLNFGTWWAVDVTVEIDAKERVRFGNETALTDLAGKTVRVRGFLQEKAGPMMRLTSPLQLEVIDHGRGLAKDTP